MDIEREGVARHKLDYGERYTLFGRPPRSFAAGWRINQLKPAAPAVERSTVWIDTVKRGPMVRDVRGIGTLVPEDIQWIQAEFDSQVNKILAQSVGDEARVRIQSCSFSLIPQMEADANDFEWQTKQAGVANYADLQVRLQHAADFR